MKITKIGTPIALLAAAALTLSACAVNERPAGSAAPAGTAGGLTGTLTGKGASSMAVAQQQWIKDFQTANRGVTVNYAPDGSGAGREAFMSGAVQYAGSDRAFKDDEMTKAMGKCVDGTKPLNLPVYISPIAIVFNVEGVTDLKLSPDALAGIFKGQIKKWNDPKIAATNAGASLPDANITAVHRSDDSGTTENFTDYLNQAAPSVWTEKADGAFPTAFGGEAAKGTAGVVDAVRNGKNTIGYADESQAGSLGKVQLQVGSEFLSPTAEAAGKIVAASPKVDGRAANDWALKLDRKAAGAYPVVLVSYALVCEQYKDANDAKLVKAFVGYAASDAGQKSAQGQAGNAPLPADMQAKIKTAVDSIK